MSDGTRVCEKDRRERIANKKEGCGLRDGWAAIITRVVREGITEKVLFERSPERDEGGDYMNGN